MPDMTQIKPGDRVAVIPSGVRAVPHVAVVDRVTKTRIVLRGPGKPRYRRKDGREVGERSAWHWKTIQPLTRDIEQRIERARMERVCSHFDAKAATDADLKRVVDAIELAVDPQKEASHA